MSQAPLDYETPQPRPRRPFFNVNFTKWELLTTTGIIAILVAILLPTLHTRHPPNLRVHCMSNLRYLGNALMQYAQQNGGIYPPRLVDVCTLNVPPAALVCPASKTDTPATAGVTPQQTINNVLAAPNHITYVYLAGGQPAKNFRTAHVLAYEPITNHPSRTAYATVLFGDGHAAAVPANVLAQMIKELNAGQNPPPATKGY